MAHLMALIQFCKEGERFFLDAEFATGHTSISGLDRTIVSGAREGYQRKKVQLSLLRDFHYFNRVEIDFIEGIASLSPPSQTGPSIQP